MLQWLILVSCSAWVAVKIGVALCQSKPVLTTTWTSQQVRILALGATRHLDPSKNCSVFKNLYLSSVAVFVKMA